MKDNYILIPSSINEIKSNGCIFIENLNDGFNNRKHYFIGGEESDLKDFLLIKIKENKQDNSYIDFYYYRLNDEEKENANSVLSDFEIEYLKNQNYNSDNIFFKLNPIIFEIAFKLSISEMLFSTFYFSEEPCTIWSNYNKQFIVFL